MTQKRNLDRSRSFNFWISRYKTRNEDEFVTIVRTGREKIRARIRVILSKFDISTSCSERSHHSKVPRAEREMILSYVVS